MTAITVLCSGGNGTETLTLRSLQPSRRICRVSPFGGSAVAILNLMFETSSMTGHSKHRAEPRTAEELGIGQSAELPPEQRASDFREVTAGLSEKEARFESARCYSCGNCFECDGCYGACPESAIIKLGKGKRYEINYDRCTGCQACFLQCPCHAIEMVATEMPA